ncbi:hypothetical protein LTR62_002884 [Meristemomyces frigidus]|uniref:Uncharacterized protein n=1 Tax=Meristemomyces frigidus TaxID=1508187 RepID=A0AAN7YUC0_9PEZI|nr:hypothetical protein LTR62_002884 [Meristemomyces frigidus]
MAAELEQTASMPTTDGKTMVFPIRSKREQIRLRRGDEASGPHRNAKGQKTEKKTGVEVGVEMAAVQTVEKSGLEMSCHRAWSETRASKRVTLADIVRRILERGAVEDKDEEMIGDGEGEFCDGQNEAECADEMGEPERGEITGLVFRVKA